MNTERRRHEVRDERGQLIAVIDIVGDNRAEGVPSMVELAADFDGAGYRVRIFGTPARSARLHAA